MESLFKDGAYYTTKGMQIEDEMSRALQPIIEKYIDMGYGHREICFLALQASHDATLMVSLDRATSFHK